MALTLFINNVIFYLQIIDTCLLETNLLFIGFDNVHMHRKIVQEIVIMYTVLSPEVGSNIEACVPLYQFICSKYKQKFFSTTVPSSTILFKT